ncbi:hypothetical protein [Bradyrhizobium sp. NAS80.1]|uniref:hypothetical protein n=1 Tax=Bradyrhizobium sp. NAS80.1 TaxID=1680159 RepID=UPI00143DF591|nr:hypothetical protein [Bradyrhizobium sp. NAS80.1]
MQRPKDAANPSSRPYSLTRILIKGAARRGNWTSVEAFREKRGNSSPLKDKS